MAKKPIALAVGLTLLGLSGGAAIAAHMDARRRFQGHPFRGSSKQSGSSHDDGSRSGVESAKDWFSDTVAAGLPLLTLGFVSEFGGDRDRSDSSVSSQGHASSYEPSHSWSDPSPSTSSYSDSSSSTSGGE
jgi:hypothetical protein